MYGSFLDGSRRCVIKKSPYYFCPFIITDGDSTYIKKYFRKQEIINYLKGLAFVGIGGFCLYTNNKRKK